MVPGSIPGVRIFWFLLRAQISKGCQLHRSTFARLRWSSGYDARLTRERSPVQSWDEVVIILDCNNNTRFSRNVNAHAGNRTRGTSMGSLYVTTTLRAPSHGRRFSFHWGAATLVVLRDYIPMPDSQQTTYPDCKR